MSFSVGDGVLTDDELTAQQEAAAAVANNPYANLAGITVPQDIRESMAELRRPTGQLRACRWLLVAAAYSLAGAGLCYGMWELYFGSSQMSCDHAVLSASRHAAETFIGALPVQLRSVLLGAVATKLCQKITAARNQDGSSLAVALLVVGTDGDADTIQRAGWDAIVGDATDKGGSNPQSSWTQAREARKLTQRLG